MTDYPIIFSYSAESEEGENHWKSFSGEELEAGLKEEFGGDFEGMAPENLYAHSLANCYIATFKVIARNSGLKFEKISVSGELKMEKTEKGILLTELDMEAVLKGAQKTSLAESVLEKTSRSCPVLNSVKTEKNFSFRLN